MLDAISRFVCERNTFLEETANPSASLIVGAPMISAGISRSRVSLFITRSCDNPFHQIWLDLVTLVSVIS